MFEDTPPQHHPGQPWTPNPTASNLQEQSQQTTTNLPLIAAILGTIIVVSIVLGLVGWACKLHRRKLRWGSESKGERDVEKAEVRGVAESVEVERRDSEMTAVGEDEGVKSKEVKTEHVEQKAVLRQPVKAV